MSKKLDKAENINLDENRLTTSTFFTETDTQVKGDNKASVSTFTVKNVDYKVISALHHIDSDLLKKLRSTKIEPRKNDNEKGEATMKEIQEKILQESKNIEVVRKENFFNEEITEEEREIISRRVALQQRQFAAYEEREGKRKSIKIRTMFDYVCDEEITELLQDCKGDEDEIIYRLTRHDYLLSIRKKIALKYAKEEDSYAPLMTNEQRVAYEQLLKKRSVTLKKSTNDQAKKQYRMCGRLGLDEALEQIQNNQVDPEKAFEGWSEARVKAYQMIEQNPNSYYYRFNAPGEIQRRGQWDEPEKKLFFKRLEEVGANGQWGLFSMTIPGRVGYQCSNFYRLLVETKTINDPNYVLDDNGKAHYLFDKKSADGQIKKTFRTHVKNGGSGSAKEGSSSSSAPRIKRESKRKEVSSRTSPAPIAAESSSGKGKGRSRSSTSTTTATTAAATASSTVSRRKKRNFTDSNDEDDDDEQFDDDFSGSYRTRASRDLDEEGQRKSKRARRPTTAAIESGLATFDSWHADDEEDDILCPLPGFIDPITLEQIVKPAISKYGHVMGYDSWVRCLNNWEGKKNTCPLTKKPLTKRELVVLTLENIDEYRDKILNT